MVILASPACDCSGTCRTCAVVSGPSVPCLLLLRDLEDLCCHLRTHSSLHARVQGPVGPVVSSRDSLPLVGCSGTHRTWVVTLGPAVPCLPLLSACSAIWGLPTPACRLLRDPQDLCCRLGNHLPCRVLRTTRLMVLPWDPLPPDCSCSGTCRTCGVILGPTGTCLPLLGSLRTCVVVLKTLSFASLCSGPRKPVLCLETHCPLPATCLEPSGPVVSF